MRAIFFRWRLIRSRIVLYPVGVSSREASESGADAAQALRRMGVHDLLHTFFPLDEELLSGFSGGDTKRTLPQIALFQVGHVDE